MLISQCLSVNTIIWTDEFSIGNPSIDKGHARIIERYNEMAVILSIFNKQTVFTSSINKPTAPN